MSDERDGEAAGLVVAKRRSPASKILDGCFLLWKILAWLGRTTYWSVFQITIPFLFWMTWSFLQTIWLIMRLSYSLLLGRGGLQDLPATSMVSSPPSEYHHHHYHHHHPTRRHENVSGIPWMSSPQGKTYSEDTGSTCSTSSSTRVSSSFATSKPPASIAPEEKTASASTSQTLVNVTRIRTNEEDDHNTSSSNRSSRSNSIDHSSLDPENKDFDYLWESLLPAPDDDDDDDTSERNNETGDQTAGGGEENILLLHEALDTFIDTRPESTREKPTRTVIFRRPKRLLSKRNQPQAPPRSTLTTTSKHHQHQPAKSSQAPQNATMETKEPTKPVARTTLTPSWWSKRRESQEQQWMTGAAHHPHGGCWVDGGDELSTPGAATAASKQEGDPMVMQMVFFDRHKRNLAEDEN